MGHRAALLLALLACGTLAALSPPATAAGAAPASARAASGQRARQQHASAAVRFCEFTELAPDNVRGLMALVPMARDLHDNITTPGAAPRMVNVLLDTVVDDASERAAGTTEVDYIVGGESAAGEPRSLTAWDRSRGRALWRLHDQLPVGTAALVTAGGLVFYGTRDGWLKALDARSGALLWKARVEQAPLGEPESFRGIDGHQYVAVSAAADAKSSGLLHVFSLPH